VPDLRRAERPRPRGGLRGRWRNSVEGASPHPPPAPPSPQTALPKPSDVLTSSYHPGRGSPIRPRPSVLGCTMTP
jgi:hypothetical protein